MNYAKTQFRDIGYYFIMGFTIALAVTLLFTPMIGFIAGVAAGVAKGLKNLRDYYIFEWPDLWAIATGAGVAALLALTII